MSRNEVIRQVDIGEVVKEYEKGEFARLREKEARLKSIPHKIRNFAIGVGAAAFLFGVGYLARDIFYSSAQRDEEKTEVLGERKPLSEQVAQEPAVIMKPETPALYPPEPMGEISGVAGGETTKTVDSQPYSGNKKTQKQTKAVGVEGKMSLVLDERPADSGDIKWQDDWFDYWGNILHGRVIASMGDLYAVFKDIKKVYEYGSEEEKAKVSDLLANLRDDFNNLHTRKSTIISYQPNNLNSKIIQHYRCSQTEMVKEIELEIPEYLGKPITKVVNDPKGLNYLHAFFETNDDAETIIQTLEFISDKKRNNIKVWTPPFEHKVIGDSSTRVEYSERVAGLTYSYGYGLGGTFDIIGDFVAPSSDDDSYSCLVLVKPR